MNKRRILILLACYSIIHSVQAQYTDCGLVWGPVIEMSAEDSTLTMDHYHPLIQAQGDTIHYVWEPQSLTPHFRLPYKRSTDDGLTWEPIREILPDTILFQAAPAHKVFVLSGENLLIIFAGGYNPNPTLPAYFIKSSDRGTTWSTPEIAQDSVLILYTAAAREDTAIFAYAPEHEYTTPFTSTINGGLAWSVGAYPRESNILPSLAMLPGVVDLASTVYWNNGPRETFLHTSQTLGDSWPDSIPLVSLDWNSSDYPSITGYNSSSCGLKTLAVDWRDAKYGGFLIAASTIARLSFDGGVTWRPEVVLTDNPESFLCSVTAQHNVVAALWTHEVAPVDTYRIQARYSTDGGVNWEGVCEVTPESRWATFASLAVTRTAIHVAWEQADSYPSYPYFKAYYRRGEFQYPDVQLSISPITLQYDTVPAGSAAIDSVLISNPGTDTLSVSLAFSENQDFWVTPESARIAPGEQQPFWVIFQPVHEGPLSGKIFILSNSWSSPDCITMSGTSYWIEEDISYDQPGTWQLVSKPLAEGPPEWIPSLYAYQGSYEPKSVIEWGQGYWGKPPSTMDYHGATVTDTIMAVRRGWNILGSISLPIDVGSITSDPDGIIASSFYGWKEGYVVADSIMPGKGYWVKVKSEGTLRLNASPP